MTVAGIASAVGIILRKGKPIIIVVRTTYASPILTVCLAVVYIYSFRFIITAKY
jgi:hypothetical protein